MTMMMTMIMTMTKMMTMVMTMMINYNFELNSVVGRKVTFPQRQGNEGEVETSLSINYIQKDDELR